MCEPTHSVVQYPAVNIEGDPVDQYLTAAFRRSLSKGQQIGDLIHYSMAGFGHSECISKIPTADSYLPAATRYEGNWWDRTFAIDGPFNGPHKDQLSTKEAFDTAAEYSRRVSTKDIPTLQQFVRDCIQNSERPETYVDIVLSKVLRGGARAVCWDTLRAALAGDKPNSRYAITAGLRQANPEAWRRLQDAVTTILTKRENFSDVWADDQKLWTPDNEPLLLATSTTSHGQRFV